MIKDAKHSHNMPSLKKHSITIAGHATSFTLEDEFWAELQHIADQKKTSIAGLIRTIDETRGTQNLSSAIRIYILMSIKKSNGS